MGRNWDLSITPGWLLALMGGSAPCPTTAMTPQLLQAWLSYIQLEEFTAAEVEQSSGHPPRTYSTGVSVVGNQLLLEQRLWKQLKELCAAAQQSHAKDFQLGLSGPAIYRTRGKGTSQTISYLPLFVINVNAIFVGPYRKAGWDLLKFPCQPIVPNLVRLCGLDEDQAESLVIANGLLPFLEDTFSWKYATFQAFLNDSPQIPKPYRCQPNAYLLCSHRQPYNTHLKADLRDLLEATEPPQTPLWQAQDSPAWAYLYGKPSPPNAQTAFWGLFPSCPPDLEQALALKHAQDAPLTAICGAAGTGKTEIFLHRLAQQQVQRANSLLRPGEAISPLSVFAAKNNSTLERFQNRLGEHMRVLPGGNQSILREQTQPALQRMIQELRQATYAPHAWTMAKQRFEAQLDLVQALLRNALSEQQRRDAALNGIEAANPLLQACDNQLASCQIQLQELEQRARDLADREPVPLAAYRDIRGALEQAWQALPRPEDPTTKRVWDWLMVNSEKSVIRQLETRSRPAVLSTLATAYPFQLPVNREQLAASREQVASLLGQQRQYQPPGEDIVALRAQVKRLQERRATIVAEQDRLQSIEEGIPQRDVYSDFFQANYPQHVALFEASQAFLAQELLRQKERVIRSLQTYGNALSGEEDAQVDLKANGETIFGDLSLAFPVITSGLLSIRTMALLPGSIQLALIDEAGATALHQPFPLLARAKQAMVAGDPYQIEPIVNLCEGSITEYHQSAFAAVGMSDLYATHGPTARYSATAYHRAAGADVSGNDGGIMLKNHYRSAPAIAQFCAPTYPQGLTVHSPHKPSLLGPNLVAYPVEGYYQNHSNPAEVAAVEAVTAYLLKQGYQLGDEQRSPGQRTIGVLSPYYNQVSALRQTLQARWCRFPYRDIATVHDFQGTEKAVIVLSAYRCSPDDSFWFLNRAPNLLNTAVSRARELFILVGNLEQLERAGGETQRLVQHIRDHGQIEDLPKL